MYNLWRAVETLGDSAAVPVTWRKLLGPDLAVAREVYLRKVDREARTYPCEFGCGCRHEIVRHANGEIVAVCVCEDEDCDLIELPEADTVLLEMNLGKLGRAVGAALCGEGRDVDLGVPGTWQVGAAAKGTVPVVMGLAESDGRFRAMVAELVARLRKPFVLVTPTSRSLDGNTQTLLTSGQAEFLDLQSHLTMSADGSLVASEAAMEVLARMGRPAALNIPPRVTPAEPKPQYLLRKGQGVWRLVFDGQGGEIDDGRGIALVAHLLFNPPSGGLHGTELASLVFCHSVVVEASLGADGDSTRKVIQQKARECWATLNNPASSELDKDEARDELEELARALNVTRSDSEGNADRQVRAVRRSIDRLIEKLRGATDRSKNPQAALRAFGEHLHKYLWTPSSRFSGDRRSRARAKVAGRFTYEPPDGVQWEE